jgi:hypothetical protein
MRAVTQGLLAHEQNGGEGDHVALRRLSTDYRLCAVRALGEGDPLGAQVFATLATAVAIDRSNELRRA